MPSALGPTVLPSPLSMALTLLAGVALGLWWGRRRLAGTAVAADRVVPPSDAAAGPPDAASAAAGALRDIMAAAAEQADELIALVHSDGVVAHANAAFCRALGYELADVRRCRSVDLLAEPSRASLMEIDAAVRADGVWRGTLVRKRRDGGTFLSSCSVLALALPSSTATHFVTVERDITHEMHLREQLIHSERLAAVGQLVSGVAHELNNPLQSIVGFTELLIDTERRQEPRADLEQVRAAAHRAAKIVRNLLAFVRRSAVTRSAASFNELVQATVALRRYEFAMLDITLVETYGDDLPPVVVNREEIQQVLLNLLLNAEQAMKPTGRPGHLALRTFATPQGVTLELSDNGPGVPATVAGRIFEPFYSTKDVGEGTGLGLSIALGIAEAHGGTLELVPSREGACFRLTVPSAPTAVATPQAAVQPAVAWTAVPGRRALVADDDAALRKLLHRLLTRRGFAVDLAEDGLQASGMIEAHRYDVILCDVQMPRMTGTQLYDSLRRRQPRLASTFVLISGDSPHGAHQGLVESAQVPLLSKPFGAKNLDLVLDLVLSHRTKSLEIPDARAS